MPPAAPIIGAAAFAAGGSALGGATILGLTVVQTALVVFAASRTLETIVDGKPKP